jgi:archaellum component FlaC
MEPEIIELLKNIEKRLEVIEQHLGIVKEDCSKMGNHIDFIEKTYNVLRQPLNYVTRIINSKNNELPQIKNNDSN